MEEAPENGKESSNSAHANGMNEWMNYTVLSLGMQNSVQNYHTAIATYTSFFLDIE